MFRLAADSLQINQKIATERRTFALSLDEENHILYLVAIHVLIGTLWSLTLITATRYAAGILKKPAVVKWMDRTTGCLFLLFAAKLAMSRR